MPATRLVPPLSLMCCLMLILSACGDDRVVDGLLITETGALIAAQPGAARQWTEYRAELAATGLTGPDWSLQVRLASDPSAVFPQQPDPWARWSWDELVAEVILLPRQAGLTAPDPNAVHAAVRAELIRRVTAGGQLRIAVETRAVP